MDAREVARGDWSSSRARSAAVAMAWRQHAEQRALASLFDVVAASDLTIARDRAATLLNDADWVRRLLAPLVEALADDPLFEPPLKVSRERGRIGAVLFDAPAVRITASIASARALAGHPALAVIVPGRVSVTRYVRAGGAALRRWQVVEDHAREQSRMALTDGDVVVHDGRSEGHVIVGGHNDTVMVTAILRAGAVPQMREFAVADGALLRVASTDDGAARAAMLLTLLRVSERTDTPQLFDAATRDIAPHARWSAMREWLALDVAAALPRLREMTDDDSADIRATAVTTLALVERRRAACQG